MEYQASKTRYETMRYVRCGKSGLKLPCISLGLWQNFGTYNDFEAMRAMLRMAFDGGVTHFDMANNYGPVPGSAEENFGRLFAQDFKSHRDELILSSKAGYAMWVGPYGDFGSRKSLLASLDQSLKRTGLSYFDIFYHHRMDAQTPLEETMGALATAVQSGKALYAGLSNYDGATAKRAAAILKELRCPFVLHQNRYSIFDRTMIKNGLRDAAIADGQGIIAFSPLAQGLLTSRYLNGVPEGSRMDKNETQKTAFLKKEVLTPEKLKQLYALDSFAANRGQTLAQLALTWVLSDSAVTSVLIGASSAQQVRENLGVQAAPALTPDELRRIEEIVGGE
ncbi:MAG: aldo/keto reductase [Ruthenibacterium sp.]